MPTARSLDRSGGTPGTARSVALALVLCGPFGACDDSPRPRGLESFAGVAPARDGAVPSDPDFCRWHADGEACGVDRHCIGGRCHLNICGDAIMSGDEQCDDGNAQVGDGCTPSCRLELMRCEDGRRLPVGDDCEAGQDDDPDAGSSPSYREDCPRFIRTTIEPRTTIVVGQTAELSVRIEGEGNVLWMSQPDDSTLASSELFSAPDALSTRFTCPDFAQSFTIFLFTSAPGCRYPRSKTIRFHCVNAPVDPETDPNIARPAPDPVAPDTSTSDAGSSALAPDLDGGARDAGPETLDAPPGDASQPADASAADAASARGYRSLPCETCVNAACVAYSGIDFIGPCFGETLSPDFSQRCADVFFCSHHSPDLCAYNVMRGPVGCFCGESVSVDACQEGTVQGNCVPQWYAASGCTDGDHRCVLERFIDLERPSGYANFLLECKNTLCAAECAP